jgi:hypothetical protein
MLHIVTATSTAVSCPGIKVIDPACQILSLGGSVASDGVNAVLSGLSQWVASGAEWLLAQIGDVLISTTSVNVGAGWFTQHYQEMAALSGVVLLPLLLVSTMQAIYKQSASHLLRVFFVQLPLALLLGVVGIQVVRMCLAVTDAMSNAVAGGANSDLKTLLAGLAKGLVASVADPTMATFVLLLVGLLVAIGAFVLWLELLIRAAAVYAAVLFLPLALATLVWPAISHMCRRLVETLAALILSKFVIVATLSLAAGAISSGTAGTGDAGSGFAAVLAGGALLVLATFVPFSILRLIPMIEAGAVGHLDGLRSRGTANLARAPRSAARQALESGRERQGGNRLLAAAGSVGTATYAAGGSQTTTGTSDKGGKMGNSEGEGNSRYENRRTDHPDGSVSMDPGPDNAYAIADLEALRNRPKGPNPLRAARIQKTDSGEAAPTEEDGPFIGNPGPRDNKYIKSHNAGGVSIKFVRYGDRTPRTP